MFAKICWAITLLIACITAFSLFSDLRAATSAPQQAAAAAMAAATIIIPYVFSRAVSELSTKEPATVVVTKDAPHSEDLVS
jgi:hypothetical protein